MTSDSLFLLKKNLSLTDKEIQDISDYANKVDIWSPHCGSPNPTRNPNSNHRVLKYQQEFQKYNGTQCNLPGAENFAYVHLIDARQNNKIGNRAEADEHLGRAIHYIQDALNPPHIFLFREGQPYAGHFWFEKYADDQYCLNALPCVSSKDWRLRVRNAPIQQITNINDFPGKIINSADWVHNFSVSFVAQNKSIYSAENGVYTQISTPPSRSGWKMSDDDIGAAMERASSLVKGAAVWVFDSPNVPENISQFKQDGNPIREGETTAESTVIFKGTVSDPDLDQVKLQVELRRIDEFGGQFDETQGGLKESDFVASGSTAIITVSGLVNGDYHWRYRAKDSKGVVSEWKEFGMLGYADFIVDIPPPPSPTGIIATGAEPGSTAYNRKLATTSDGHLHAVYSRKDSNGILRIYHVESADGGKTWTEEPITDASHYYWYPSIAVDSKDRIQVIWGWCEEPAGFGKKCTIQYRNKTNGDWQPIEDVITSYGGHASIAVDSQDNIHLVVNCCNLGSYNTDYVKYLKKTSSGWSSPETVSYQVWAGGAGIAIDQNDNVHVVFTYAPYYEPLVGIKYSKRTANGIWQEETIKPVDQHRSGVSMALDSSENVYAVWGNYDTQSINISKRTPSGSWQEIESVWHESGYRQDAPTIAIDSKDRIHVVWSGKSSGSPTYSQLRHRRFTTSWEPIEDLTSSTTADQNYPNLMWALYPEVNGIKTNEPQDSYSFIWMDGTTIKYESTT